VGPDAVVLGELHLVRGGECVIVVIIIRAAMVVGRPRTPLIALLAFDPEEARTQELLLLAVLGEGGLERGDLILQWNKGMHHFFNGFEAVEHLRHGDLRFVMARPCCDGGIGAYGDGNGRRTQAS
jgi:hypothetical protein